MAYLNWGTPAAQPVTVSFWVKSNQTGSFPFIVADANTAYDIGKLYTISLADTWEYKTITIDGPTVGTFNTDNTAGAYIYWGFGAIDAARTAQGTTWGASNSSGSSKSMVTGASTALATTSGATFYITGVQLEAGSTASPFAHENVGDTLQKCYRYYYRLLGSPDGSYFDLATAYAPTAIQGSQRHPVTMRANPAVSVSGNIRAVDGASTAFSSGASITNLSKTQNLSWYTNGCFTGLTTFRPYFVNGQNSTDYFEVDAEL